MNNEIKILFVEDNQTVLRLIQQTLRKGNMAFSLCTVEDRKSYTDALTTFLPDIILADYSLPSFNGDEAYSIKEELSPEIPFIIISGVISEENAVELIKKGITDYVLNDTLVSLPVKINRALYEKEIKAEKAKAEEKIRHVNHLYSFISNVNHAIIHIRKPQVIFKEVCRVAVEVGHFHAAWIGYIDIQNNRVQLIEQNGLLAEDVNLFNATYERGDPQDTVIKTDSYYVCNNTQKELKDEKWKAYATARNIGAFIVLPIRQSGEIVSTLNIYTLETDFFDDAETQLLEEVVRDISFVLDVHKKEELRTKSEVLLKNAYDGIQTLIDHTDEIFITVDKALNIISFNKMASDTSRKYLRKELQKGKSILEYTFPNRVELLRGLYMEVLTGQRRQTEVIFDTADNQKVHFRTLMKPIYNSSGAVSGVFIIERNITEEIKSKNKIEFDHYNLHALINNTKDLMWSVDRDYKIITANSSFLGMIKQLIGKSLSSGDDVLDTGFGKEQQAKYKEYYNRAFAGEAFMEVEYSPPPYERWSEMSFYPIQQGEAVIGTACFAHDITRSKVAEARLEDANRMYAFISQINQTIVHVTDERTLFDEACRIAVDIGKFELACIDKLDRENSMLNLVAQNNAPPADIKKLSGLAYGTRSPIARILQHGKCYVINDYDNEPEQDFWAKYAFTRAFKSAIFLPIKEQEEVRYVLSLFSAAPNMFDSEEVALLSEAAGDISFALDVFDKERQRKVIEDRLKHNEQRLNQAQKIAHLGSWELNFATGGAVWSEEACRIYGLRPDDNIQSYESWVSFIHPDDLNYVMKITKEGQDTLKSTAMHHRIVRPDGQTRHVFSQSHFEFNDKGVPIGLYGVTHDVTDIKEAEAATRKSQTNLRLIVDLIPQSIFAMDASGRFVFANKSFAELYGMLPSQLVGKVINEILPGHNSPKYFIDEARRVIRSGKKKIVSELIFTDYKGRERVFYSTKVPYNPVGHDQKAMLGISMDITEQKQAETERIKMIADMVQRNKDLEQFSYIVSHNLRAPVANIIGLTALLQNSKQSPEEERFLVEGLLTSVRKMDDVIRDMNSVLQIKSQTSEKKELIKLSGMFEELRTGMGSLLQSKQVEIITDFSETDEIHSLKSYLYSIFLNLISNSVKFRQEGLAPVVSIKSKKNKTGVVLIYKDNSLGIDIEKHGKKLFGLYNRFQDHIEGKGVGLFMVKTQVDALGGVIEIKSKVNSGVVYTISFDNA